MLVYTPTSPALYGSMGGMEASLRRVGYVENWGGRVMKERVRRRKQAERQAASGAGLGLFGSLFSPPPVKDLDVRTLPRPEDRRNFMVKGVLQGSKVSSDESWSERQQHIACHKLIHLPLVASLITAQVSLDSLHDLGYRHGSLGVDSVILTLPSTASIGVPGTIDNCRSTDGLRVVFGDLGFGGLLEDAWRDREMVGRAEGFAKGGRVLSNKDVEAFARAEDYHALGVVWMEILFGGALVEKGSGGGAGGNVGGGSVGVGESLSVLFLDAFKGNVLELRQYVLEEERYEAVVEVLDGLGEGGRTGWEILGEAVMARELWGVGREFGMGWV